MKVFIAGCGRSGTTYLRLLLDSHKKLFIPLESLFLVDYLKKKRCVPRKILNYLLLHEPFLKQWKSSEKITYENDVVVTIDRIHNLAAKRIGAEIWGQKTPRFVRHMDLFNNVFPDIKWILVYRDPRAVVSSMLQAKDHTYSIYKACKRWVRDNRVIIQQMRAATDNVYILKYEDLILDFNNRITEIERYLDISEFDLEAAYSRTISNEMVSGNKNFANCIPSGLKPNSSTLDKWKEKLSGKQIRYIEKMCSNEMKFFGYDLITEGKVGFVSGFWRRLSTVLDIQYVYYNVLLFPSYAFYTAFRKIVLSLFFISKKQ